MRTLTITIAVLILSASSLTAQQPVDVALDKWRDAAGKIRAFEADCERITRDRVFKVEEKYKGRIRFLKTNASILASIEFKKIDNPAVFEKLIVDDRHLYEYASSMKQIRKHELPKQQAADNFVSLLVGMNAKDAKKRFGIVLERSDDHYNYLKITPRLDCDKGQFDSVQVAVDKTTNLPSLIRVGQVNGNDATWGLSNINLQASHLRPDDFAPKLPAGWSLVDLGAKARP